MFIYLSPVWKYCIITQQRINTLAFVQNVVLLVIWEATEGRDKKKRTLKRFLFAMVFSFIGTVSGDWHKGKGVWAWGVSWKQRPAHIHGKRRERGRRGMREFLFVCPWWKFTIALFLSSLSFYLPLHRSSSLFAFFSITLSHEAPLPSKHPSDLWRWGIYIRHRYKHPS